MNLDELQGWFESLGWLLDCWKWFSSTAFPPMVVPLNDSMSFGWPPSKCIQWRQNHSPSHSLALKTNKSTHFSPKWTLGNSSEITEKTRKFQENPFDFQEAPGNQTKWFYEVLSFKPNPYANCCAHHSEANLFSPPPTVASSLQPCSHNERHIITWTKALSELGTCAFRILKAWLAY